MSVESSVSILLRLPLEILTQIALMLHPRDVKYFATTCRKLQTDLILSNEFLWFKFLNTLSRISYPVCLQIKSLLPHDELSLPTVKPLPTVQEFYYQKDTEKFEDRAGYYIKVIDILNGKQRGCFDCLSPYFLRDMVLVKDLDENLELREGASPYRTYCSACQEKYFWDAPMLDYNWGFEPTPWESCFYPFVSEASKVEEYGDIVETDFSVPKNRFIHRNDAIKILEMGVRLDALLPENRFERRWQYYVKGCRGHDGKEMWKDSDLEGIERVLSEFIGIIADDIYATAEYVVYHQLKSPRGFRIFLEYEILTTVRGYSATLFLERFPFYPGGTASASPIAEVIIIMASKIWSIDRAVKEHPKIWDMLCASDPDATIADYINMAEGKGSRYKYIYQKCKTMLNMAFRISTDTKVEFNSSSPWGFMSLFFVVVIEDYRIQRFGSTAHFARYCPSKCPYCGRSSFTIADDCGESWNGLAPEFETEVDPKIRFAYRLLGHIWSAHNARFSERWEFGHFEEKYEEKQYPWQWLSHEII
ncbi:hypothetical protein TWF694_006015 [Orbilia ellipsospora]|uniref:F-box domain-containing protein n=1 Tax=Orbilia ellipsospora TaxID=2528407 RepID=A0AAV9WSC6_9PEZI